MFSPFLSCIAAIMVLMIFEFLVSRAALVLLLLANIASCSTNNIVYCLGFMVGDQVGYENNREP